MKCPKSNHDVSSEAPFRPNCGYPMKKEETYIGPKPIDPIWIKKYKKKAFRVSLIHLYITIVILALFITSTVLSNHDRDSIVWFVISIFSGIFSLAFVISAIVCFCVVKAKAFNIDGYNIVAYCGYFKNVLVVENIVMDSAFSSWFHNTDIFARLPNGKPILARFSIGSAGVRENHN